MLESVGRAAGSGVKQVRPRMKAVYRASVQGSQREGLGRALFDPITLELGVVGEFDGCPWTREYLHYEPECPRDAQRPKDEWDARWADLRGKGIPACDTTDVPFLSPWHVTIKGFPSDKLFPVRDASLTRHDPQLVLGPARSWADVSAVLEVPAGDVERIGRFDGKDYYWVIRFPSPFACEGDGEGEGVCPPRGHAWKRLGVRNGRLLLEGPLRPSDLPMGSDEAQEEEEEEAEEAGVEEDMETNPIPPAASAGDLRVSGPLTVNRRTARIVRAESIRNRMEQLMCMEVMSNKQLVCHMGSVRDKRTHRPPQRELPKRPSVVPRLPCVPSRSGSRWSPTSPRGTPPPSARGGSGGRGRSPHRSPPKRLQPQSAAAAAPHPARLGSKSTSWAGGMSRITPTSAALGLAMAAARRERRGSGEEAADSGCSSIPPDPKALAEAYARGLRDGRLARRRARTEELSLYCAVPTDVFVRVGRDDAVYRVFRFSGGVAVLDGPLQ